MLDLAYAMSEKPLGEAVVSTAASHNDEIATICGLVGRRTKFFRILPAIRYSTFKFTARMAGLSALIFLLVINQ